MAGDRLTHLDDAGAARMVDVGAKPETERAEALAEVQPELRAGVHTGECERRDGTLSGAALEIAASVAGVARPGEILATSTVHDLVALSGIAFEERGMAALPLAGASREWRLFAVVR